MIELLILIVATVIVLVADNKVNGDIMCYDDDFAATYDSEEAETSDEPMHINVGGEDVTSRKTDRRKIDCELKDVTAPNDNAKAQQDNNIDEASIIAQQIYDNCDIH